MTDEQVIAALQAMPPTHANRWCPGGICACIGCANVTGGLAGAGVTKEQWERSLAVLRARTDAG